MKLSFIVIFSIIFFSACTQSGIEDKSKRNENWAWWVSAKTGLGEWVKMKSGSFGKWFEVEGSTPDPSGTYTRFYFNGNIYAKVRIRGTKTIDTIFYYDLNGKLEAYKVIDTAKGDRCYYIGDGLYKHYNATGKLILSEGIVKNHTEGDKWKRFYENGKPCIAWNYYKDTGWIVNYYENGQMKDSSLHRGQNAKFVCKSWYPNGQLKEIHGWKSGVQEGISIEYYENGQKEDSSFIINGMPQGNVKMWFMNGRLSTNGFYKKGKEDGEWIFYFENGIPKSRRNCKNGKYDDQQVDYYESGHVKKTGTFDNGTLVGKFIIYDEKGRPIAISK